MTKNAPTGTPVECLVGLADRLQVYFDERLKPGAVSIGIGDGVLFVYEHVRGVKRVLPAWMALEDVPVRFEFVGRIRTA